MDYMALDFDEVIGMVETGNVVEENHKRLAKVQENYSTRVIRDSIEHRINHHSFLGTRKKRRW